jgi:hypothetical protein
VYLPRVAHRLLRPLQLDDEALVFVVGFERDLHAGVPVPGPDGLDGEGEGVALAAGDREEGAGVAFGGFSAGHRGKVVIPRVALAISPAPARFHSKAFLECGCR